MTALAYRIARLRKTLFCVLTTFFYLVRFRRMFCAWNHKPLPHNTPRLSLARCGHGSRVCASFLVAIALTSQNT